MTSKISSFNIAREDLRHRLWMVALSCLGSFLALPVFFLLIWGANSDSYSIYMTQAQIVKEKVELCMNFFQFACISQGIVLVLGAMITGICGMRHLFSRKMCDLIHSVPVKRSRIFFIYWLDGLLIWLVPMLVCMLATLGMTFLCLVSVGGGAYIGQVALAAVTDCLFFLIAYLTVYHLCLICACLSGNALNALCSAALFGLLVIVGYGVLYLLCNSFFQTFVALPFGVDRVIWASPLAGAVYTLIIAAAAVESFPEAMGAGFFLVMNILLLLINLFVAARLYITRDSTLAERGINSKVIQHGLRIVCSFLAGLLGALFFYYINENIAWELFGAVLCSVLAFGILDVILHMNFRVFFSHKWEMLAMVGVSAVFFLLFPLGLISYDSWIPAEDNIESISFSLYQYKDNSYLYLDENGELSYSYTASQELNYEDAEVIYTLLDRLSDDAHLGNAASYTGSYQGAVTVTVQLQNGSTFQRRYWYMDSDVEYFRPIIESDAWKETFYRASTGSLGEPSAMSLQSAVDYTSVIVNDAGHMAEILEAYYADFEENYQLETLANGCRGAFLDLTFTTASGSKYEVSLPVYEYYTRTLEVIRSYYPNLILSIEDLDVESFTFEFSAYDMILSKEGLGSYFRLEGYPDYDDYLNQYWELYEDSLEGSSDVESAVVTAIVAADTTSDLSVAETADNVISTSTGYLYYTETDPDALADILSVLHVGERKDSVFEDVGNTYIKVGYLTTSGGETYSCYIAYGELPEEWLDLLLENLEWEYDTYYYYY